MRNTNLTENEIQRFKELFSKFCRGEINEGHCEDDECGFCPIGNAYTAIFVACEDDEDECEDEEITEAMVKTAEAVREYDRNSGASPLLQMCGQAAIGE